MASEDVERFTAEEADRFERELRDRMRRIEQYLFDQMKSADVDDDGRLIPGSPRNVRLAAEVGKKLQADFEALLGKTAPHLFIQTAARIVEVIQADLGEMGVPDALSTNSIAALHAHVDGTLDRIASIAANGDKELRRLISATAIGGVPVDDLLADFAGVTGRSLAQATTEADTGGMALDRSITIDQSSDAGFTWFLYDGPDDSVTREWCDARVGFLFHVTELDEEENDVGPNPPSDFGGGYRCRHRWVAIDASEIRDYPRWQGRSYDLDENGDEMEEAA